METSGKTVRFGDRGNLIVRQGHLCAGHGALRNYAAFGDQAAYYDETGAMLTLDNNL